MAGSPQAAFKISRQIAPRGRSVKQAPASIRHLQRTGSAALGVLPPALREEEREKDAPQVSSACPFLGGHGGKAKDEILFFFLPSEKRPELIGSRRKGHWHPLRPRRRDSSPLWARSRSTVSSGVPGGAAPTSQQAGIASRVGTRPSSPSPSGTELGLRA